MSFPQLSPQTGIGNERTSWQFIKKSLGPLGTLRQPVFMLPTGPPPGFLCPGLCHVLIPEGTLRALWSAPCSERSPGRENPGDPGSAAGMQALAGGSQPWNVPEEQGLCPRIAGARGPWGRALIRRLNDSKGPLVGCGCFWGYYGLSGCVPGQNGSALLMCPERRQTLEAVCSLPQPPST